MTQHADLANFRVPQPLSVHNGYPYDLANWWADSLQQLGRWTARGTEATSRLPRLRAQRLAADRVAAEVRLAAALAARRVATVASAAEEQVVAASSPMLKRLLAWAPIVA